jgi:hypothetical protein
MKLENQVCSLEQAKRLKEFGIVQQSFNWWKCNDVQNVVVCTCHKPFNEKYFHFNKWYAAFSVAELGCALTRIYDEEKSCELLDKLFEQYNSKLSATVNPNFLADMLIISLENKLITTEEVNQRLLNA